MRPSIVLSTIVALAVGCAPAGRPAPPRELTATADPLGDGDPIHTPQPHRDRPGAIVLDAARHRLWVALQGTESEPGREVIALDATTYGVVARVSVGPFPVAMAIHPAGDHLVVLNRFARFATVIDLRRDAATGEIATPYYSEAIAFSADGRRAYVANRWRDAILRWEMRVEGEHLVAEAEDDGSSPDLAPPGLLHTVLQPSARVRRLRDGRRPRATSESGARCSSMYDR
jgi:DNA-binding beta-propeller fold protein YncE